MLLAHPPGRLLRCLWRCAKKVRLESFIRAHGKEFGKQIDTRHPDLGRKTDTSRSPDNSHPVNAHDIAIRNVGRENRIASHIDELRDIERHVLQPSAAAYRLARKIDGFGHCEDIDGATQKTLTHSHPR